MIKISELTKEHYRPKDVARFLGVTTKTLRNWDSKGKICFRRDLVSDRRYLTKEDVIKLLEERELLFDDISDKKRDVIYARVPLNRQGTEEALNKQVRFLLEQVPDLQNILILSEIGSGMDEKREKLNQLIELVSKGVVSRVFVTYPDRLARFGYGYLETIFKTKGVKIEVIKQKDEERTLEEERKQDINELIKSL